MDPLTIISTALTAGAAEASKQVASDAVKSSYSALRLLISKKARKLTGGVDIVDRHEADPAGDDGALRAMLAHLGADQDKKILKSADELLKLADPQGFAAGKYRIDYRNSGVSIIGSPGAIVGNNNYQQFRDPRTRSWIIFAAILTVVLIVSAVGVSTYMLRPAPQHPQLEVTSVEVKKPSQIDADYSGPNEAPSPGKPIDVTNVDITLKNNGAQTAVITNARIDILFAEQMQNCLGAGPGAITASYLVDFPVPPPPRPFTVNRDMRFYVKSEDADRFTLNIGPQTFSAAAPPYLVVARISLVHDNMPDSLDVGTVAIVAPSGKGTANVKGATRLDCITANSKLVDKVYEIQAVRADEIDELHHKFAELLAPDPAPAQEQCREWPETPEIPKLCARYTREQLTLSVTLGDLPTVDETVVAVHLDSGDPSKAYRIVSGFHHDDYRNEDVWSYDFEKDPGILALSGTSTDVAFDADTRVLTIKATPPVYFNYKDIGLFVSIDKKVGFNKVMKTAGTPSDAKLAITRGT